MEHIQSEIKGIELRVYALGDGIRVLGAGGNYIPMTSAIAGIIALEHSIILVAAVLQSLKKRIPLVGQDMILAVVDFYRLAVPVLGVADFLAVQLNRLDTPCIGDNGDGIIFIRVNCYTTIVNGAARYSVSSAYLT